MHLCCLEFVGYWHVFAASPNHTTQYGNTKDLDLTFLINAAATWWWHLKLNLFPDLAIVQFVIRCD